MTLTLPAILLTISLVSLALAAWPAILFLRNMLHFRPLPKSPDASTLPPLSVLIPARNEESSIAAALHSILANEHENLLFEIIVLDDHSTDRTPQIVREIATNNPRVRLESAPPLPPGWCGKQHACHVLASLAKHPILLFIDADVRLAPTALARIAAHMQSTQIPLSSGFPRQVTITFFEQLLLPLMHFILLGFLPLHRMQRSPSPAYSAGCGQLFIARADAYHAVGGHAAIRTSLHDGLTLPRAFRTKGLLTDLFDATDLASCRMYHSAPEVFRGLMKNATEGLASPTLILPVTLLLLLGQVLPIALIIIHQFTPLEPLTILIAALAASLAYTPRLFAMIRFRQSPIGAILHPLGISLLLILQWLALLRQLRGTPSTWKGRAYAPGP